MGRYIVLDTGAILRLGKNDFMEDVLLTVPSVLREIKDKTALDKLAYLQDRIRVLEPADADRYFVMRFSKETGDFGFLSETDFQVIALTLTYHKKFDDVGKLNNKPREISLIPEGEDFSEAGMSGTDSEEDDWGMVSGGHGEEDRSTGDENEDEKNCPEEEDEEDKEEWEEVRNRRPSPEREELNTFEDDIFSSGWVTKDNITSVMGGLASGSQDQFKVACMTTDYSMQNVLLQMGLNLIEIHGFSVKTIKRWGLLCCGCFTFERDSSRKFCGKCGNATLDRVPIKVFSDGRVQLDSHRKKVNLRGTIYSIPRPKRGVRNEDIILAEDQLMMGGREKLLNHQRKKWERLCRERDPFSNSGADLESSWGKQQLGGLKYPEIKIGMGRGNPNSNSWQKRRSKKK
ncbi:Nin one binding (NOB1) Zn-ribbon family protein [Cryptosporidium felis]|nr:Nin one binding (NOB1) Zn-ribbon family protein [Cryptosporidium felis]